MKITVVDKLPRKKYTRVELSSKIAQSRFVQTPEGDILLIKVAPTKEMTPRKWLLVVRSIVQFAKQHRVERLMIAWEEIAQYDFCAENYTQYGELFAVQALMASYEFRAYKSKPQQGWNDVKECLVVCDSKQRTAINRGIIRGKKIAHAVNVCRDLANTPGGDMTPSIFAQRVRRLVNKTAIKMRTLSPKQMHAKKMNGVLAVGGGSAHAPRFMILEYYGTEKTVKPTVLVGKGVTFDSGGIDVKPYPHGLDMMMDMSGGAAVVATIIAVEALKLKKNIIALVPAVENMISGTSFRPGDVIRMMNGTTVEVRNTDAEGRLILADALTFAQQYEPECVVDVATLTGASLVALGERASAILTRNSELERDLRTAGERTGDFVWPLPLWEEYESEIKSDVADIANLKTQGSDRYGGTITAGIFLHQFAKDFAQWAHVDIAPRMTAVSDEFLATGATGVGVRLLVEFLS